MANDVARIILEQLGGTKFIVMTGSKDFIADNNTLRMTLVRNKSGSNRLEITLEMSDTYTMRFYHYRPGRIDRKTLSWVPEKIKEVKMYQYVYYDQLQDLFTQVTGMNTHL